MDWVDGQLSYLEAHETAVVINFCMSLLQIYSSHNIGKVNLFPYLFLTSLFRLSVIAWKQTRSLCTLTYICFFRPQISLSLSSTLLNEAKTERYKDLRALLQLLSHLCSKDMVNILACTYCRKYNTHSPVFLIF